MSLFVLTLFVACEQSVETPDFDVTVKSLTVYTDSTMNFELSGDADFVSFFSGEEGHEYVNRSRVEKLDGDVAVAVSPDKPVVIKHYRVRMEDHQYKYTQEGAYKATFVGVNADSEDSEESVVELTINVVNNTPVTE